MKVYISGAITGTTDYMERFRKAAEWLKENGYTPINPAAINAEMPEGTTYEEYMKISLVLLDMSDAIYFMDGWEKSCGANREHGYALAKDKIVIAGL